MTDKMDSPLRPYLKTVRPLGKSPGKTLHLDKDTCKQLEEMTSHSFPVNFVLKNAELFKQLRKCCVRLPRKRVSKRIASTNVKRSAAQKKTSNASLEDNEASKKVAEKSKQALKAKPDKNPIYIRLPSRSLRTKKPIEQPSDTIMAEEPSTSADSQGNRENNVSNAQKSNNNCSKLSTNLEMKKGYSITDESEAYRTNDIRPTRDQSVDFSAEGDSKKLKLKRPILTDGRSRRSVRANNRSQSAASPVPDTALLQTVTKKETSKLVERLMKDSFMMKERGPGQKSPIKKLGITYLSRKFGRNYLRAHVRVKRLRTPGDTIKQDKMKRKTVSFVETVEVFGETDFEYCDDSDLSSNPDQSERAHQNETSHTISTDVGAEDSKSMLVDKSNEVNGELAQGCEAFNEGELEDVIRRRMITSTPAQKKQGFGYDIPRFNRDHLHNGSGIESDQNDCDRKSPSPLRDVEKAATIENDESLDGSKPSTSVNCLANGKDADVRTKQLSPTSTGTAEPRLEENTNRSGEHQLLLELSDDENVPNGKEACIQNVKISASDEERNTNNKQYSKEDETNFKSAKNDSHTDVEDQFESPSVSPIAQKSPQQLANNNEGLLTDDESVAHRSNEEENEIEAHQLLDNLVGSSDMRLRQDDEDNSLNDISTSGLLNTSDEDQPTSSPTENDDEMIPASQDQNVPKQRWINSSGLSLNTLFDSIKNTFLPLSKKDTETKEAEKMPVKYKKMEHVTNTSMTTVTTSNAHHLTTPILDCDPVLDLMNIPDDELLSSTAIDASLSLNLQPDDVDGHDGIFDDVLSSKELAIN